MHALIIGATRGAVTDEIHHHTMNTTVAVIVHSDSVLQMSETWLVE
jgi:hypothetical protein